MLNFSSVSLSLFFGELFCDAKQKKKDDVSVTNNPNSLKN